MIAACTLKNTIYIWTYRRVALSFLFKEILKFYNVGPICDVTRSLGGPISPQSSKILILIPSQQMRIKS